MLHPYIYVDGSWLGREWWTTLYFPPDPLSRAVAPFFPRAREWDGTTCKDFVLVAHPDCPPNPDSLKYATPARTCATFFYPLSLNLCPMMDGCSKFSFWTQFISNLFKDGKVRQHKNMIFSLRQITATEIIIKLLSLFKFTCHKFICHFRWSQLWKWTQRCLLRFWKSSSDRWIVNWSIPLKLYQLWLELFM